MGTPSRHTEDLLFVVISTSSLRAAAFFEEWSKLGSSRDPAPLAYLEGVQGRLLDSGFVERMQRPPNQYSYLRRGEVGCYLSHVSLWLHCVQTNRTLVCFEDDCTCTQEQRTAIEQKLHQLGVVDPEWRLCLLYRMPFLATDAAVVNKEFTVPARSWGLQCYAIRPAGAMELLRRCLPIRQAADTYVSSLKMSGKYALSMKSQFLTIRSMGSETFESTIE